MTVAIIRINKVNAFDRLQMVRGRIPCAVTGFLVLGIEAEFMYAACNTVQLVALYAQPEFAYAIANPPCSGTPVAKNQAGPHRLFQIATGHGHCGNTSLASPALNRDISAGR